MTKHRKNKKKIKTNRSMDCFLVRDEPTSSPILCIDDSAPILNSHMPMITKKMQMMKITNWLMLKSKLAPGIKCNKKTATAIGKVARTDSSNFLIDCKNIMYIINKNKKGAQ